MALFGACRCSEQNPDPVQIDFPANSHLIPHLHSSFTPFLLNLNPLPTPTSDHWAVGDAYFTFYLVVIVNTHILSGYIKKKNQQQTTTTTNNKGLGELAILKHEEHILVIF